MRKSVDSKGKENKTKQVNNKEKKSKGTNKKSKKIWKKILIAILIIIIVLAGICAGLIFGLMGGKYAITKEDLIINLSNSTVLNESEDVITVIENVANSLHNNENSFSASSRLNIYHSFGRLMNFDNIPPGRSKINEKS